MAISPPREVSGKFSVTVLPFINTITSATLHTNSTAEEAMKQKELEEFYATYNVWTGIRTAATLSLFFLFTVTVIVYKSKCKKHRKYELYPSLEDLPGRPLDYYDYWPPGDNISNHSRRSDDKDFFCRIFEDGTIDEASSAPLPTFLTGGDVSPSLRNSFRVKSLPGSVMRINCSRMNSLEKDDAIPSMRREYLRVPGVRLQSTGSSSDGYSFGSTSFDLPYDATPMTLLGIPGMSGRSKPILQTGGIDWEAEQATAEWLQTIDINVIQPTPNVSPCGSIRSIADHPIGGGDMRLGVPGRGRSASLASTISHDCDSRSIGSDSVFFDDSGDTDVNYAERPSSRKGSQLLTVSPQPNKRKSIPQRQVHSFRLPICEKGASSPIPAMLEGQPLRSLEVSMRSVTEQSRMSLGSNLGLPLGIHLSGSCERLAAHETLKLEQHESLSRKSSNNSIQSGNSFDGEPVVTSYVVPNVVNVRRCNSAKNSERRSRLREEIFRRADSDTARLVRAESAEMSRQNSNSSSSSTEDASDSVSFHLMVPHLSFDCPSNDVSRASSPSLSPTPPDSPSLGVSLSVPMPLLRSTSPSRGRLRILGSDTRGVLKRQYSQYMPASPREKPPSPFLLPTSFEEDEEIGDTPSVEQPPGSDKVKIDSLTVRETKF